MPKAPTTYDSLRRSVRTEREALTLAVVLPNLPDDDRIIDLRGSYDSYADRVFWDTPDREMRDFKRHLSPIVPGTDLYRVSIVTSLDKAGDTQYDGVKPVPHGFRTYAIDRRDFAEFVSVDPEDAEYDDTGQATLDEFGCGNPYYNPWYANRDAFGRNPKLPV